MWQFQIWNSKILIVLSAGSRDSSPSSRFAYATYSSPYAQQAHGGGEPHSLLISPPTRGTRRMSSTSSASSSRDTSPQGRILGPKLRSRSISNSPQVTTINTNSSTAKMLLESREAESTWADALRRREYSELDYGGNHSDSEDSMSSHRSFRSETFSPPTTARHFFPEVFIIYLNIFKNNRPSSRNKLRFCYRTT